MRGIGEIDIGRPRWREDPAYVIEVILGYLQITDRDLAPDTLFTKGREEAQAAIKKLQSAAEATFAGKFKSRLIAQLAQAVRQLAGLRESPKFHIIQLIGLIRAEFLSTGKLLMAEGKIERPDDLFYLTFDQLQAYAGGENQDWQQIIRKQRKSYQREKMRTQLPRLLLSDGRAYYEGLSHENGEAGLMAGSPVSPGTVEGPVRVVTDPLHSGLKSGEIMVCPGTDPAWTPLFMTAAGLIMEVGGMMTHGAIVAREYGIPAVVGVDQATNHLHTGQQVKLDGTTGEILLLDQD
jgi:pyruvate,water dikinase